MYTRKDDKELKQLAIDIVAGKVFTSAAIHESELKSILPSVFMSIAFMGTRQREEFQKDDIQFIYEYVNKAEQRSVNGYPIFMTCRMLNREDLERLMKYREEVIANQSEFLSESN